MEPEVGDIQPGNKVQVLNWSNLSTGRIGPDRLEFFNSKIKYPLRHLCPTYGP